jgi:hypothetical protein
MKPAKPGYARRFEEPPRERGLGAIAGVLKDWGGVGAAVAVLIFVTSLRASLGRPVRITFSDGVVQTVIIGTVDGEGFLHCRTDHADRQIFWTRFEDVNALEFENQLS